MFLLDYIHSSIKLNTNLCFPSASLFAALHFCLRLIIRHRTRLRAFNQHTQTPVTFFTLSGVQKHSVTQHQISTRGRGKRDTCYILKMFVYWSLLSLKGKFCGTPAERLLSNVLHHSITLVLADEMLLINVESWELGSSTYWFSLKMLE